MTLQTPTGQKLQDGNYKKNKQQTRREKSEIIKYSMPLTGHIQSHRLLCDGVGCEADRTGDIGAVEFS